MTPSHPSAAKLPNSNPIQLVIDMAAAAKVAASSLAHTPNDAINTALLTLGGLLRNIKHQEIILKANAKDLMQAETKGLSAAMIDRLTLTPDRLDGIAQGVEQIAALDNPRGKTLHETTRPNGLQIQRVSVPIGLLGMIYESRPNVTVDAAALCLKSGNAVILRGGSESLQSSLALHALITQALEQHNIPTEAVSIIPTPDRAAVGAMLACHKHIDVMIPRGGKGLIERVQQEATMPVFSHLDGLCHVYLHQDADAAMARDVVLNAKMRRTGICGAAETLLIDAALDEAVIKDTLGALLGKGCALHGDAAICAIDDRITPATDEDWSTEYLDAILSVKMVADLDSAIAHINQYGSQHTDSIITMDTQAAERFLKHVESAIVMHNASTQFADGGEFGMGAEIGIATGKFHARGPVGLEQLCTYAYHVRGNGQTRP